jgi:hypothetical protein
MPRRWVQRIFAGGLQISFADGGARMCREVISRNAAQGVSWVLRIGCLAFCCLGLCVFCAGASAAATWLAPTAVSSDGLIDEGVQVASDSRGDVVAAWTAGSVAGYSVFAAVRPAGGGWQPPVRVSTEGQSAGGPQVAFDAQGDAMVVFERLIGPDDDAVEAATLPAGGIWTAPQEISGEGSIPSSPALAVDAQGDAVAAWGATVGGHIVIRAIARPAGGDWQQTPTQLSAGGEDAYGVRAAFDSQGDLTAVWTQFTGSHETIEAATRPYGGVWPTTSQPVTDGTADASGPVLAVGPQGTVAALWTVDNGGNEIVQGSVRPAGSATWQTPISFTPAGVNSEPGGVAVTSGGEVLATWSRRAGSSSVVEAAVQLPSNGVWQPTVDLTSSTESAGDPVLGVDPAGDATAVWSANNSSGGVVQSSTLRAGETAWPAATNVSSSAESADQPQVAVDAQGNAVAAWSSDHVVDAAGYDAAGPLLDAQSIPTSGTVGKPVAFSVSPLDVWSAIASTSWHFGDDQSASGAITNHTYTTPGKYTVGLSSVDTLGNASTAAATIAIAAAPAQPPATTSITGAAPRPRAPQLTHVSETHKTWQEGTTHAMIAANPKHQPPVGTRFGFRVNQATRVTFAFTHSVTGRLISHNCQKQTRTNRKHAHCRLTTTPGTLAHNTQPGQHSLSFQGRLSGNRHLPVGAYTLRITATNPTTYQASKTESLRFTIVKPS